MRVTFPPLARKQDILERCRFLVDEHFQERDKWFIEIRLQFHY